MGGAEKSRIMSGSAYVKGMLQKYGDGHPKMFKVRSITKYVDHTLRYSFEQRFFETPRSAGGLFWASFSLIMFITHALLILQTLLISAIAISDW